MNIHALTSAHLKQAIDLLAKKESLQSQLAKIDEQVIALLGGDGSAPAAAPKKAAAPAKAKTGKGRPAKTKGRGALKASIIDALRSAGPAGISIKDLVEKLGSKSANLHAWFNMTGKKVPGLEKIGRGMYRLEE